MSLHELSCGMYPQDWIYSTQESLENSMDQTLEFCKFFFFLYGTSKIFKEYWVWQKASKISLSVLTSINIWEIAVISNI